MQQNEIRWFILLPTVFCVFVAAGIASDFLAPALGLWFDPFAGATAAFCVVLATYAVAPNRKLFAATGALVLGAVLAWVLIRPPSSNPWYEETYLPYIATLTAGSISWSLCALHSYIIGRHPNKSLEAINE